MNIKYLIIVALYMARNAYCMNTDNDKIAKEYHRDLTLNYSTELFASTDFDGVTPLVSPIVSPRGEEVPQKNRFFDCIKKFYCCLWCCCCKKQKRLVVGYDTI
jgi:hypothetical protein